MESAYPDRPKSITRNRPLLTLTLGHFTLDTYVGLLPVLYPLLIDRFSLDLKTVGLVSLAYVGTASLSQPLFGWLADRYGTRFIGAALIWTAAVFATIGFAPSFPILLFLAAAAGIGSGAYHPLGALAARAVIPQAQRNTAMSVYVTGGTLGVALGPIIGAALFSVFDIRGTALMFLPGVGIAAWLLYELRPVVRQKWGDHRRSPVTPASVPLVPLLAVVGVMMSRAWTLSSIQAFVPTWYDSLGYSASFYGPLTTTIVLAGGLATVVAGSMADRYGRRAVIIATVVLSIPAILIFVQFTGSVAFITGGLAGALVASTGPLVLVMAQELMARRAGMASGLILGLGFVTGAIGVPVTGAVADAFGMQAAMRSQALIAALTLTITWLLPHETSLRDMQNDRSGRSQAESAGTGRS